jgi:hypothetical protein
MREAEEEIQKELIEQEKARLQAEEQDRIQRE